MSEAAEPVAPPVEGGPGQMLAQMRGERKLSIADVAQRLKYGARQIEALEAEEFDKLPGATFVRGMVRGYAKLLETDPQPVLDALDQRYIPVETDLDLRDKGIPFAHSGKRGTRAYLALSVLVLIVVASLLYEWRAGAFPWVRIASDAPPPQQPRDRAAAKPAAAQPAETTAPAPVPSAATEVAASPPPPQSRSEGRIRLDFDSESWVEIKEQDGRTLMSQLNSPGTRAVIVGRPPLSLVIGNAAAVRLTYNDKPVDLKPHIQIEVARLTLE
ncbi:MAG TPA: RodZ domain-containing protein [Burkholderiales bacterium]|nr:RodZ domain-containing protein [Burkholderiales bacterium]